MTALHMQGRRAWPGRDEPAAARLAVRPTRAPHKGPR
jgi:hypothetical protein